MYKKSHCGIDELQLTSSFSRQKHWTAKRASFFRSVHALNMKRCGVTGVCGGKNGRVWGVSVGKCVRVWTEVGCVEKCGVGVVKCVGVWEK